MAEPLKVVVVSDFGTENGGAAKVAIESAIGLAAHGVQVIFAYAIPPLSDALQHPMVEPHCLDIDDVWAKNPLRGAVAAIWNNRAGRRLGELLATLPFGQTIVHFHQWTKAFSPSALAAARRSGHPCIVSMHDYFLACPNGNYFDFPRRHPCSNRPMSTNCIMSNCDSRSYAHKVVRLARQVGVERAITGCPGTRPIDIVHVSGFARKIAEPFLTEAGRHFVVANPIDMARKPAVNVRGNQEFLFLGRLTPEKEPVLFAKAAAIAGVAATFLGTGPEETAIRAAYPEARLLGWGQRSDVEQALSRARGLVFPSLWNETSGLVVAEAIARGVPAIVSRATAAHELIDDGMTGFRFDPGDLEGLVSAIRRLGDDDVAEQMGVNAFEAYWRDPPTRAAHASKLLEIYDFIIRDMTPEHREATDENNLRV